MTKSSSAAQIVSTVSEEAQSRYWGLHDQDPDFSLCEFDFIAAAAIRAAADQVVPEADVIRSPCREHCAIGSFAERARRKLFAIAAELDGTQPLNENV